MSGTDDQKNTAAKRPRDDSAAELPPFYQWKGDGPPPASWYAPDGTKVYRSYEDYCDD